MGKLREYEKYVSLSVLGTLGLSCYILVDTFFVSNRLGADGLTALNLAIPVYNIIYGCSLMLGMGGAAKFAISKKSQSGTIFTNTIYIGSIMSAVFVLLGIFCSRGIAEILGADAYVLDMTTTYIRWLLLMAPAFMLNEILIYYIRNDGAPKLAMAGMLSSSFSNIVLDYVFMYWFDWGIFGAVFATGLAPIISIICVSKHWRKKKNTFRLEKAPIHMRLIRQMIVLGFPSLLGQFSVGIVMIIFNTLILQLEGNVGVAAYGVIANIALVVTAVYTGIADGMQPLVSRYYGKGQMIEVKRVFRWSVMVAAVISLIMYGTLYWGAGPITSIFNSEGNKTLQSIAQEGLRIYFTCGLFAGMNTILAVFFSSMEKNLPAHMISLSRGLVVIIPMVFILSALWGMTGIWLTYPVTELLVMVMGILLYIKTAI